MGCDESRSVVFQLFPLVTIYNVQMTSSHMHIFHASSNCSIYPVPSYVFIFICLWLLAPPPIKTPLFRPILALHNPCLNDPIHPYPILYSIVNAFIPIIVPLSTIILIQCNLWFFANTPFISYPVFYCRRRVYFLTTASYLYLDVASTS